MSDDEEIKIERDEKGRVVKGSKLHVLAAGKPRISARALKRERREMRKEINQKAQEVAQDMLNEKLGDVIDAVYARAMDGDTKAMSLWLRHSTPVAARAPQLVDSELLAEMQNEPPETIIQITVRAMASGEIDVQMGKELIAACRASIEANFTDRFRKLMRKAQAKQMSLEDVTADLMKIAEDFEPVLLEHDDEG